jgi:methylmalonyl-CoA mutase
MQKTSKYQAKNHIRIVTAASLFDGHDAAINVMRRIIQSTGAEVIHLGHNRSVQEIVECAVQEDVQSIAITSYQGGHIEFFKYMYDLLKEKGRPDIKIFGGGGGVILPDEINELHDYGIARIYSPDDGRKMGLQGMINDLMEQSDFPVTNGQIPKIESVQQKDVNSVARMISLAECCGEEIRDHIDELKNASTKKIIPVLGITGTGGSGKSSLVDELVRRFIDDQENKSIAIISVDPSKRKTGGALLGDRIRMNSINHPRVYMRSLATRQANLAMSPYVKDAVDIVKAAGYDLVLLETSGIGQSDTEIIEHSDVSMYVMTPEYGAATQLEKIDMLDFADIIAINKFDKRGALDALRDVKKQYQRNHELFDREIEEMPVYGTVASQFNDPGVNTLYFAFKAIIKERLNVEFASMKDAVQEANEKMQIIPPNRVRYLSEISETVRNYNKKAETQAEIAGELYALNKTADILNDNNLQESIKDIKSLIQKTELDLDPHNKIILENWKKKVKKYSDDEFIYTVRGKDIKVQTFQTSLSHTKTHKISLPKYKDWGDILKWNLKENVPGEFPFAAGVFPFKREGEDPTRMFAGEGGPERTNKRFHYVSLGMPAKRLSTAFDSVTLYGEDPGRRPDIYGKIGNSGVSIACLDDAKKLYSGFDLTNPKTSVSMTINGPAPIMTAYFMNAAIDQECEKYIRENGLEDEINAKIEAIYSAKGTERPCYQGELPEGNTGLGLLLLGVSGDQVLPKEVYNTIKAETICRVRGTVQADILKEDQAQNTCIYSTDFSLKLMGDMQEYFIEKNVRNFYSVSISGYHIAEAGANPISQLAFTLANGFTYVEYYASRGMDIK